ncbi:MAG: HAMP domain-containing histidine kinase [Candidatus Omnitrophica bacterium]|nr:HAMP domain-containing histidine kinase [Candidatus Omnitrophota bacterium]
MRQAPHDLPVMAPTRGTLTRERQIDVKDLMSRFNFAFSLMSVIPLLTCAYLITVRFFSVQVLFTSNGAYFFIALVIALLGLLAGHELIRDMIRRLVEANAKLQKLNEQQASFVSNVAHEFRAPLGVFKGALDNLGDGLHGPVTAEQMEPIAMCQKEVNRLSRLVRDLLELARMEAGKVQLAAERVKLQDIIAAATELFRLPAKERKLTLIMEVAEEPVYVTGDTDRLQQVFINLLGNAVKYTDVGSIRVRMVADAREAQVEIIDSGQGIEQQDLDRIFDKFERVGSQTEEGSGLGLPIARDIVELHHGRLWAESQSGQGSRFIVQLPLAKG